MPDLELVDETTAQDVRIYAADKTEQYYGKAFDWRTTEFAGRWTEQYPVNVIFGRSLKSKIIEELVDLKKHINEEIDCFVKSLHEETSTYNILDMVSSKMSHMSKYYLREIGLLNYGEYTFNSMFYNTRDYNSLVTAELIDEVKKHPEDWAMCLFDCHF